MTTTRNELGRHLFGLSKPFAYEDLVSIVEQASLHVDSTRDDEDD